MSDISKLKVNNTTYDLKDTAARSGLDNKVDKIQGKSLSTNDYTNADKALVAEIAEKIDVLTPKTYVFNIPVTAWDEEGWAEIDVVNTYGYDIPASNYNEIILSKTHVNYWRQSNVQINTVDRDLTTGNITRIELFCDEDNIPTHSISFDVISSSVDNTSGSNLDRICLSPGLQVDTKLDSDSTNPIQNKAIAGALSNKVDKVNGKGLSTNDYTTAEKNKLAGISAGAEVNVQANWTQTTTTADDYIKNKPTLGTASAKDVPSSGNASTSQVVMGNDTRLSDARTPTAHNQASSTINAMTGYSKPTSTSAIATNDTLNSAIGKLERALDDKGTSNFSGAYADLTGKPTLGTAAAKDVPSSGNASTSQVVMGNDTRLTNSRTPTAHNQASSTINAMTGYSKPSSTSAIATNDTLNGAIGKLERALDDKGTSNFSGAYSDLTGKPTLGTAAAKDIPSSGNASTSQVVMGNDTRLSDARTPTSHTHTKSQITDFPSSLPASNTTDSYSSTGTAPVSGKAVAAALGTLDVSSVGGSGKYIQAISETDGKISATAATMPTSLPASNTTDTYSATGTAPVSGKAVAAALATLPEPMVFKGSVGTNGTVTTLPTDGSATIGDTYKVITAGTYAGQASKVGDTFICQTKTSSANTWVLIPSGDEPSGTVTSVATGTGLTGGTITSSGTISHADTSSQASVSNSGRTYIQSVTLDGMGHVTGLSSATETVTNTDTKVTSAANHYAPATATGSDISASATGASAAWSIDVVKGVTLNTDGKGHVTGLSVTSGKIPGNPNTDTKVTSAANHYAPATATGSDVSASASGASAAWSIDVVKGVTLNTDGKGHVTGMSVTSGKIPANPNTDTKVTSAANHYTPSTASGSDKSASASGATAAWGIDVVKGVTLNTDGKGHVTGLSVTSGKVPSQPSIGNGTLTIQGNGTSIGTFTANQSGASTINVTPANIGAATSSHNHDTVYTHKFNYGGTDNATKIKIKINSTTTWMLSFVVNLYQGYRATSVLISGYQYGSKYWYSPRAVILGDSNNAAINVYFGYDSVNNLWVGFDGGDYTGVSISNVTNGYTQIDNFAGLFTISNVSSLATLQSTITAQPPSLAGHTHKKSEITDFPTIPTVNNATLTIQKNGSNVATFTANSSTNATANISVPTKVSELTNDSGYTTNTGTVTSVKVGSTSYSPSSGVVSLPAYPTSLPASNTTNSYSSTGTVPVSGTAVAAALGTLDVSSVGGSGKYIQAISETDGKISATAQTLNASAVGLGNVGNFKAVSTVASQGLTSTEQSNARANIGAGTSNFSGAYSDLTGKPTLGTAAAKDIPSSGNASTSQVVMGNDTRLSDARTPTSHNQASNTINAMTGYSKPSSTSAISTSDTLNSAIGKLEKGLDSKGTGTVTSVKVGSTSYSPSSGVVSLPAYPTSLPASNTTNSYSSTGTVPVSGTAVAAALGTLDVSSVGGSGKYIQAISETDGKISATAATMPTSLPASNTTNSYSATGTAPVSGTAVAAALATLDVSSVGGSGKYIQSISETDGKISAVAANMPAAASIDDEHASTTTTYSSSKIESMFDYQFITFENATDEQLIDIMNKRAAGLHNPSDYWAEGDTRHYDSTRAYVIVKLPTDGSAITIGLSSWVGSGQVVYSQAQSTLNSYTPSNLPSSIIKSKFLITSAQLTGYYATAANRVKGVNWWLGGGTASSNNYIDTNGATKSNTSTSTRCYVVPHMTLGV